MANVSFASGSGFIGPGPSASGTEMSLIGGDSSNDIATFDEIRLDNRNFEHYERQFQEVLISLENDEVLEAFRAEYAALHHSFLKSHDGETRLLKKCIELQADIESCVAKLHAAAELSRGDKTTIDALKAEIDKTQKKCRTTREREAVLKDKVTGLKRELREMDERSHHPVEATAQEAALQSLIRAHETVLKEKETLEYQLTALRQDHAGTSRRLERLLETKRSRDAELRAVYDAVDEKLQEAEAHKAVRVRKEEELRLTREEIARRVCAAQERQATIEQLSAENEKHGTDIKNTLDEIARLTESYQQLSRQLQNVNRTSQACNEENDALQRRMNELTEELKAKEAAVAAANRSHRREMKLLEAATRRNAVMEGRRAEAEAILTGLRGELQLLEEELATITQAAEADEKRIAALARGRDALHGEVLGAAAKAQKQGIYLSEQRTEAHHLSHELRSYEEQSHKQNETIYKLTRECTGYEEQIKSAAMQCAIVMTEVQGREHQLEEAMMEVRDVEARVQQQESLMEAMLGERKAYAKHYGQLRSEVTEMARRFKLILAQIKQMQEEVARRERRLLAEDSVMATLTQQRRELAGQISTLQMRVEKRGRAVQQFALEVRRLGDVLAEGEEEVGRQRRRFRDVQKERDLLGNQVVESGEELVRLYEKVRIQAALLQRSEALHTDRLRIVQELQHQTAQLSEEVAKLRQFAQKLPELQMLVNTATRELGREQIRVRALLHECERPMNLHQDHQLAWAEPEAFALTERVNALQRELVEKRAELAAKEEKIREQEQAYLQSKAAVARQLGPEMAEQITVYQGNLAKKAGQMKAMMASLKYFREQTEIYQERYDELHNTLDKLAQSYAEKRQSHERETRRETAIYGNNNSGRYPKQFIEGYEEVDGEQQDVYLGYVAPPRRGSNSGGEQVEPSP